MGKIGLTDLRQNIFRLGNQSVGKQPSMREYASQITTVNFGGTFVMKNDNNNDEGLALLLAIALMITFTMGLNAFVQLIL